MGNFPEEDFLLVNGNLKRSDCDHCNPFPCPKLKIPFFKYWTLIKIKISITCVYKEYKVKINMVQEHEYSQKRRFFLDYNIKIVIWWGRLIFGGGNKNLLGESTGGEVIFQGCGGNDWIFRWWGGLHLIAPSRETSEIILPS